MKKYIVLFLFILGTNIIGQMPIMPDLGYDMVNPLKTKDEDPEVLARNMQIMFVEQIFTKPLYSTDMGIVDPDEENAFGLGMHEKSYQNDLMARKMAEYLVDQDIFELEDIIKTQIR